MENIDRLPQWAQNKIKVLESDKENLEQKLSAIFEKTPTNLSYETFLKKYYLPNNGRVTFIVNDMPLHIQLRDKKTLEIMGDTTIQIQPRAANTIWIKHEHI